MGQVRRYRVTGTEQVRVVVADLPMACCAVEFSAAVARGLLVPEEPARASTEPTTTSVLVVAGTVTHPMEPALIDAWADLPEPKAIIAFGVCTISGGPYWDSYAVTPGIDAVIPVHTYVPGCPPRPEALIDAIRHASNQDGVHSQPGAQEFGQDTTAPQGVG